MNFPLIFSVITVISILAFFTFKHITKAKVTQIPEPRGIIPDTGNLDKIIARIKAYGDFTSTQEWGGPKHGYGITYNFGEVSVIERNGGWCSLISGVTFKKVNVPLGTNEKARLHKEVGKIIYEQRSRMAVVRNIHEQQALASL